jgi:nitrogen-specific signal transduction histidine kinase/CheY-like chemotaxis protein
VETIKIPFTLWGTGTQGVLGVTNDVTERRRLEAELRQSQKMEAIGRLAGGVAHDFNNLLTAILGFGGSLLDDVPADDPRRQDLEDIVKAARRAAELTRQLLAFGRRQVLRPRVVDLNAIVANLHRLLDRVLGANIAVELALAPDLSAVEADPGQIEQVLLNLAVNGRDAMPNGGRLRIETANVPADSSRASGPAASGRPAVLLRVSDTGVGIAPEAMRWIFEPFFTTKEHGTGLGLAMVYGIIQQSGGSIEARSTPGQGTTFDCFLPATWSAVDPDEPARSIPPGHGSATILVAEDEDAVRRLAARLLEAEGFHVLSAATGAEALRLAESSGRTVDLLLTDLSMPRMSGPELAEAMQQRRPGVRVAYMSGYPKDSLGRQGLPESSLPFLQKPFDRAALVGFVREALRSPAP